LTIWDNLLKITTLVEHLWCHTNMDRWE